MDEKEKQALIDSVKAEATAAVQAEVSELKTTITGLTESVKDERKKKQEAEAERDLLKVKGAPTDITQDVKTQIEAAFAERETRTVEAIKRDTIQKFKDTHKEFHPDNDPGGVKYAAYESKLARINLSGLTSEKDLMDAFEDALIILNKGTSQANTQTPAPYASTTQTPASPKSSADSQLSYKESELIKEMGWDEQRYLKLKVSRPSYVQGLLAHRR